MSGWYGYDLDGTLARYPGTYGIPHGIGEPIPRMLSHLKENLKRGRDCRIVTARAAGPFVNLSGEDIGEFAAMKEIRDWCEEYIGRQLPVQANKDYQMIVLYDDRAVQVEANTGRILGVDFASA